MGNIFPLPWAFIQRGKVSGTKHHGLGQISSWQFKIAEPGEGVTSALRREVRPEGKRREGSPDGHDQEFLRKVQSRVQR